MVIESLIDPIRAAQRPWKAFIVGVVFASFAVVLGLFLFKEYASMVIVSLTALVSVPLVYGAIKLEEKKDLEITEERMLLKEHGKVLSFFMFLFFGFTAAYIGWFVLLPMGTNHMLFEAQLRTIESINGPATGNAFALTSTLAAIFLNNAKVLAFCLLFSFFYGFGAIFILTWNASIIGVVIGGLIKELANSSFGLVPLILLKYSVHGIPEIAAYFMAGLAGGIISIAIVRHDINTNKFKRILVDSVDLIVGSLLILFGAAVLEVFVSPMIF